jgi:TonB family protein
MTDAKESSSLPLLMSITGAVVVVAVGGWFFLAQEEPTPERSYEPPSARVDTSPDAIAAATESEIAPLAATATSEASVVGIEAELRKARLAADADLFIFPAEQSAFYYYGQVLAADPHHAIASAELDAVLANVALTVNKYMNAKEYDEAYAISQTVATLRPEHELVTSMQQTLDQIVDDLVAGAMRSVRNGKDGVANRLLAEAARLPGKNTDYFDSVRESIEEIRDVRLAAERDRTNRAELADNDAMAAWTISVRAAIDAGNLIAPAGASARDLLAEDNQWIAERAELDVELLDAILMSAGLRIEAYDFEVAEQLIAAGENYPDEEASFDELGLALENAYVVYESNQVKKVSELVAVKLVQPRYPRAAKMRSTTGWVEIFFTVAPDGSTEKVAVNRSEPEEIFDNAAVQAVDNWEFEPVKYRGQLISQRAGTRLVFSVK